VDETCGWLIPPRDAAALAEAMQELATDDHLYRTLQQGVRKKREAFSIAEWAGKFKQFCYEAIRNR
jgi:glycosyltransferase involved in cell wall biosynthesis